MNGATLPYHLRSHKAVDRRLFIDLLSRIERWHSLESHVYMSMGAYPLEDHRLVHRVLGITKLLAFDQDAAVVERQKFNRPIDSCFCIQREAKNVVQDLESTLAEGGFDSSSNVIVWLDYTDPKKWGAQLGEFQALLDRLGPHDIVRVTVNANSRGIDDACEGCRTPELLETRQARQLHLLKSWVGEYLPAGVMADDMAPDKLPKVLAKCFASAALKAFPASGKFAFMPLSLVRYADTTQMLSITGMVVARDHVEQVQKVIEGWAFFSKDWSSVHQLVVPVLTLRERLFLERGIVSRTPEELVREIGFDQAGGVDLREFLDGFKKYYRFYPSMLQAEV